MHQPRTVPYCYHRNNKQTINLMKKIIYKKTLAAAFALWIILFFIAAFLKKSYPEMSGMVLFLWVVFPFLLVALVLFEFAHQISARRGQHGTFRWVAWLIGVSTQIASTYLPGTKEYGTFVKSAISSISGTGLPLGNQVSASGLVQLLAEFTSLSTYAIFLKVPQLFFGILAMFAFAFTVNGARRKRPN